MPATFNIPEHIRAILRDSTIYIPDNPSPANLYTLKLNGQPARKDYMDVMKVIEGAGGVWDRKKGLHTFRRDPSVELDLAQSEGKGVNIQQKFQAFYTPAKLADQLVELLNVPDDADQAYSPQFCRILEPSCGEGALLRAVRRVSKLAFLVGYDCNTEALNKCGLAAQGSAVGPARPAPEIVRGYCVLVDFLNVRVPTEPKELFHKVIMNPPFTSGQDAKHVRHALKFLRPGGRLVAIMSPTVLTKEVGEYKLLKEMLNAREETYHVVESIPVPAKTFQDTDIATLILVIDKAA